MGWANICDNLTSPEDVVRAHADIDAETLLEWRTSWRSLANAEVALALSGSRMPLGPQKPCDDRYVHSPPDASSADDHVETTRLGEPSIELVARVVHLLATGPRRKVDDPPQRWNTHPTKLLYLIHLGPSY